MHLSPDRMYAMQKVFPDTESNSMCDGIVRLDAFSVTLSCNYVAFELYIETGLHFAKNQQYHSCNNSDGLIVTDFYNLYM
jgi:hypothetical protein